MSDVVTIFMCVLGLVVVVISIVEERKLQVEVKKLKNRKQIMKIQKQEETRMAKACKILHCSYKIKGHTVFGKNDGRQFNLKMARQVGYLLSVKIDVKVKGKFEITKENMASRLKRQFGKGDILTGDSSFDDAMLLAADNPEELLALLKGETRNEITEFSIKYESFKISDLWLSATFAAESASSSEIAGFIKAGISVCTLLTGKVNTKKMLAHNSSKDPEPGVRLNNLRMLASLYPDEGETKEALSKALNDESIDIQVEAASLLQEEGMPHLVGMLERGTCGTALLKIIELLHENCFSKSIPALQEIYDRKTENETRIAILRAFETFGESSLASFLGKRLNEGETVVLVHILKALGTCGTVNEVEKIHRLGSSARQSKVREEAKSAIALIRDRFGIDKGWLSVAEQGESDGALSIVKDNADGGLSIPAEEEMEK